MGGKSSTQSERFFYVYLPIVTRECPDSEPKTFYKQIVVNLL